MQHLDMFDSVAAVSCAIGAARGLVAIKRASDCEVTNRMGGDLQAHGIGADTGLIEMFGLKNRVPDVIGAGVGLQHQGGAALDHAVHEHFHPVAPDHVTVKALPHLLRL